jgi:hypothetical protein
MLPVSSHVAKILFLRQKISLDLPESLLLALAMKPITGSACSYKDSTQSITRGLLLRTLAVFALRCFPTGRTTSSARSVPATFDAGSSDGLAPMPSRVRQGWPHQAPATPLRPMRPDRTPGLMAASSMSRAPRPRRSASQRRPPRPGGGHDHE